MTSPNQADGRSFSSSSSSQAADQTSPAHSSADEAVLDPYSDAALQRFVQADADLQTALHAYLEAAQAIDASPNRSRLFTRLPPHIVGTYELLTSIATIEPGFSPPQSLTIPSSPSLDAPASNSDEQLILYPSQVPAGPRTHPPPSVLRDREPSPSDREYRKGKRADANASTGNGSLDQNQSAKSGSSKRKAHSPLRRSSRLSKLAKTSTADVVGPGSAAAAAARSVGGDGETADSEEDAILLAGRRRRHRPVTLTDTDSESDEDDKLDM
ncbi:hypothetical protein OC845_002430 [Tilletia horrida]|nr:hypothetical protein OC845_002430 [Tilletia horrida]